MKYMLKGVGLGLALNITNRICRFTMQGWTDNGIELVSAIVFGIIITAFLISDNSAQLFVCGFTGLFTMLLSEIFIFSRHFSSFDFIVYVGGLYGSVFAAALALILTVNHFKLSNHFAKTKGDFNMTKSLKLKLMIYAVISAISFTYLVLPENAAMSVSAFAALQFVMLWHTAPSRKRLVLFVPVFIMSLNCFISANTIWRASNLIISILLYGCMFTDIRLKNDTFEFIINTVINIIHSFTHFALPFRWMLELNSEKAPVIKRIGVALAASIPCAIVLVIVLSNADMVFSIKAENMLSQLSTIMSTNTIIKGALGIAAGLFLFGVLYNAHSDVIELSDDARQYKGDLIIINILLATILTVYTIFVIIQFKYLFAGSALPEGLTYTEYARKGFFELLALTGVNIAAILTVTKLTKSHNGSWLKLCKVLCHYLCGVTIVLLISSFYRMFLYTNDDGLTRLRLFVMGFLVFEAIGLIITFVYIAKPKFNIVLVYTITALTYYVLLNIIPVDNIIAKNQIDKYLKGERKDIEYVFTLSADAVPAMEYFYENTDNEQIKNQIEQYVRAQTKFDIPQRWQRYNLSLNKAKEFMN